MASEKPLNARCAEALGWRDVRFLHGSQHWIGVAPGVSICSEPVPPFGEETPAGWACTGPLIGRFGLTAYCRRDSDRTWQYEAGRPDVSPMLDTSPNACAAIAEWVAEHVEGGEVKRGK